MEHKNFLFFDCECANCFDGVGKICSLGYVLTDDELNVIESEDVVMNPETEFDWYLFSPKNKCQLAYSKDYFRSKPNFDAFYKKLKTLFSNGNTYVAGFAVANDVGFVNSACERYNRDYINFRAFDVQNLLDKTFNAKKKLFEWAEFLECDMSSLASHKSVDDAMATMLVFKKVCEKENKSPEQLMKDNKEFFVTTEQVALAAEERKYKKEMTAKIKEFYNRRSPNPLRHLYDGQKFELNKKVFSDLERALNIAKRIYEGGGVIYERLKGKGNIVFLDDDIESEKRTSIENKGYKIIYASEIEKIVK